jgi:hypothetical protein
MTAKQKIAKDKFKKAIEYRKKNGCSLKQAFAHVYGKKSKVGAAKKKTAVKKAAKKKLVKKAAVKKIKQHKDIKSHNVKISVMSGVSQSDIDFWLRNFAPRKRSLQLEWYRDLKENFKNNNFNVFTPVDKAKPQLRALELLLNKKPMVFKN